MLVTIYIRHIVGYCSVCEAPILDAGYSDDPRGWTHGWPWVILPYKSGSHLFTFGPCARILSKEHLINSLR